METLSEMIAAKRTRVEELRRELYGLEQELIEAGEILSVTVSNAGLIGRRGRSINGDSVRGRILKLLSDGKIWEVRDIKTRIPHHPETVAAQLSRMTTEGDICRVRQGSYRSIALAQAVDAVDPRDGSTSV